MGKKNLPKRKKQNVIFACNHTSNFDAPILDIKFRQKIYYLGKIELFKNKFLGWLLKKLGVIPVDRSKADLGAIKKTLKLLNTGKNVGIFPQGTRGQEGEIDVKTVKEGIALFALRTGVPVLPLAYARKPKIFRKNYLLVGEIIKPDMTRNKEPEYADEFTKQVVDAMNKLYIQGQSYLQKTKKKDTI